MATQNIRSEFIEETALIYEGMGLTRMAGRIHGYLMVSDEEVVSFDELTQALQASKSAISTNLKALVAVKFIKPITLPGDRKTYYSLSPEINWSETIRQKMQQMALIKNHFSKGLQLRMNKTDKPSQWLAQAIDFNTWMLNEFPKILNSWEDHEQKLSE